MFLSLNTRTMEKKSHDTYQEAAEYLLDTVGQDYKNDFYMKNGRLWENDHSRLNFGLIIFNNEIEYDDFVMAQEYELQQEEEDEAA